MRVIIKQGQAYIPRRPALLLALLLCPLATPGHAAALYKWVDEDGAVHYSSQLPPKQSGKEHQQLNSQGVVVSTQEAAKTEEELAEEARAAEEAKEAARLKAIQDAKDRVLLLTFSSEEEIEMARDNRIEVIDSVIRLINGSIDTTEQKLANLQQDADNNYLSKGKEVPGGLAQKIEFFQSRLVSRNKQLESKMAEKEKIREKYEADLGRYHLLNAEKE